MSNQSQSELRLLRLEEASLVRGLLRHVAASGKPLEQLHRTLVRDLDDGGMGSIEFAGDEGRTLGRVLVEAEYLDRDGVLVSIVLNVDDKDQLWELDMWKVDFARLREYPAFEQLTIKA